MIRSKRGGVNRRRSARQFRRHVSRTKLPNIGGLARGGYRL